MIGHNADVPEENLAIYKLLYCIEIGMREFVIESLEAACGPLWWKQRLPPDVLARNREALEYERNIKWCQLIPHHPIYYIEFPDLKKVIEQGNNWRDAFEPVFGRRDIFISKLSELEPIRNRIAHNRKATKANLATVEGAYQTIATAIGEKRFNSLVSRCTSAEDLSTILSHLQTEAERSFKCCRACKPLKQLEVWKDAQNKWWFEETYLGCKLDAIKEYFSTLIAYRELPRYRGCGHKIEAWVKSNNFETKYIKANDEFSRLSNKMKGE